MLFGKKDTGNVVHINSTDDLKSRKLKPSDLNKKYIDKTGQEYKLKYDPLKKKVVITKIIKGILNGKFVKDRFDDIAQDERTREDVKREIGRMGKNFLKKQYNIDDPYKASTSSQSVPAYQEQDTTSSKNMEKIRPDDNEGLIKSSDDIVIDSMTSIQLVVEKLSDRLEMVLKNIIDSNIFNEKYDYDEKIIVEELRSLDKSNIIGEFRNLREMHEDIFKGFSDNKLEKMMYRDDLKEILAAKSDSEMLPFLRAIEGLEIYLEGLELVIKTFDDIENRLLNIPEAKLNAKAFHERQRFSDGKFSLSTCKNDAAKIFEYLKKTYKNALTM